jgi:hypothetical protein
MSPPLSIVIPTRNRPQAVMRLLRSLRAQTLAADAFEVIVVDDGSDPPLEIDAVSNDIHFPLRILRRTSNHGAHAARAAGLAAAAGRRILFFDDDVVADRTTVAAHAAPELADRVALGRTLYPVQSNPSPFYRYMAAFYARCDLRIREKHGRFDLGEYYVCNSSGPRELIRRAYDDVAATFAQPMVGGEFDEGLLALALAARGIVPALAPQAVLWHVDTKTLSQARAESLSSGMASGRMLLESRTPAGARHLRDAIAGASPICMLRRTSMRCFWRTPAPLLRIADVLALLAERGPRRLVPRWACHLPVRLARWEGMRRAIPSFDRLLQLAESHPGH